MKGFSFSRAAGASLTAAGGDGNSKPPATTVIEPVPCPKIAAYQRHEGNAVTSLVDGAEMFPAVVKAIRSAKSAVWVALSFFDPDAVLDGGHATLFDLAEEAEARGVRVHLLVWSPMAGSWFGGAFGHTDANVERLRARSASFKVRWDASDPDGVHCHHEKSWIVDPGQHTEIVFTGGMVLHTNTIVSDSRHESGTSKHDVNVSLQGPAAADVVHSFVQRWNGATKGYWPSAEAACDLPFPTHRASAKGTDAVQVLRTIRPKQLVGGELPVGGVAFPIEDGEASIFEAYRSASEAAQEYIYCENQHFADPRLMDCMLRALDRGVVVVFLAPSQPMSAIRQARHTAEKWQEAVDAARKSGTPHDHLVKPRYADVFLEKIPAFVGRPNFVFAGRRSSDDSKTAEHVYVHSKIAIVDDVWYTVGSANQVDISFDKDHTELNLAVWSATSAKAFRVKLVQEHVRLNSAHMSGADAMRAYIKVANGRSGLVFAMNPATYASTRNDGNL